MEFTIISLDAEDWTLYKAIRLEALLKYPNFFCPSRNEVNFSKNDWLERIVNPNGCIFGLFLNSDIIGVTSIVRDNSVSTTAHLTQSYIKPPFQKKGLSKLLYKSRISWAIDQANIKLLTFDVDEDNLSSQSACKEFGFTLSDSYMEKDKKVLVYTLAI